MLAATNRDSKDNRELRGVAQKTHCPYQRTVSVTLKKDPCKEMGHWKNECPNRKSTALELEESVTEGHETQPPPCTLGNSEGREKTNRFSCGHWYTHSI